MSAHCDDCGNDLVFGVGEDWQLMTCPVCTLQARLRRAEEALQEAIAFAQEAYDYGCQWPIGLDTDPQEQRGQERDTFIRNAEFLGAKWRAYFAGEEQ